MSIVNVDDKIQSLESTIADIRAENERLKGVIGKQLHRVFDLGLEIERLRAAYVAYIRVIADVFDNYELPEDVDRKLMALLNANTEGAQ